MFGKFLKKKLGNEVGGVADKVVDGALNKLTGGLSGKAERLVKSLKNKG